MKVKVVVVKPTGVVLIVVYLQRYYDDVVALTWPTLQPASWTHRTHQLIIRTSSLSARSVCLCVCLSVSVPSVLVMFKCAFSFSLFYSTVQNLQGGPKKRNRGFNFAITSVSVHRF